MKHKAGEQEQTPLRECDLASLGRVIGGSGIDETVDSLLQAVPCSHVAHQVHGGRPSFISLPAATGRHRYFRHPQVQIGCQHLQNDTAWTPGPNSIACASWRQNPPSSTGAGLAITPPLLAIMLFPISPIKLTHVCCKQQAGGCLCEVQQGQGWGIL